MEYLADEDDQCIVTRIRLWSQHIAALQLVFAFADPIKQIKL